jgi:putative acetyltransferase
MAALARLHRKAVRETLGFLPELHSAEEDQAFFEEQLYPNNTIWLAEEDGAPLGYAAHSPGWLNHLYVHPDHQGRGVASALLGRVMANDDHLQLWAFQKNDRARHFYEGKGFVLERLTDGEHNEEHEPDALYVWTRAGDEN